MLHYWERLFFVNHLTGPSVQVTLILTAKHFAKLRPRLKRGQAGVSGNKAMPISHECQQFFLLLRTDVDFAMTEEKNAINVAQAGTTARRSSVGLERCVGNNIRIGTNECVPESGFVAEALDDRQRMRSEFVLSDAVARIRPS